MKMVSRRVFAFSAALTFSMAGCSQETTESPQPDQAFTMKAEQLADQLQSDLQAELSSALAITGPVGAIGVCQSAAPTIADNLSAQSGLEVSRIASQNRNPDNSIEPELASLYAELEAQPLDGGKPVAIHRQIDGRSVYMRAIPMRERPCAACHGTEVAPEVRDAIQAQYPSDRATGFKSGDLRGAFLVRTVKRSEAE